MSYNVMMHETCIAFTQLHTRQLTKRNNFILILRWSCESKIWLDCTEARKQFLCFFIVDRSMDDDIFFWLEIRQNIYGLHLPVNRGDEIIFVSQLQRIDDAEDFSRVATGTGGVVDDCANGFLWVDEEYGTNSQCHTLRVDVGSILIIDHVVQIGNFARLVGNDGETQVSAGDFIDILNPFLMRIESICTQPNKFDTSFLELWFEFSKCTELDVNTE